MRGMRWIRLNGKAVRVSAQMLENLKRNGVAYELLPGNPHEAEDGIAATYQAGGLTVALPPKGDRR